MGVAPLKWEPNSWEQTFLGARVLQVVQVTFWCVEFGRQLIILDSKNLEANEACVACPPVSLWPHTQTAAARQPKR